MNGIRQWTLAGMLALLVSVPALPCSICGGDPLTKQTLRQQAGDVRIIVYGLIIDSHLNPDPLVGGGTTEIQIEQILKNDLIIAGKKTLTIPRYIPIEQKKPARWMILCDVANGKPDLLYGWPVTSPKLFDYFKEVLAVDVKDRAKFVQFYFRHIDSDIPEIAADAFVELAKLTDQEIGQVAPKFEPQRLRKLVQDPNTPADRLGLYAYLLGSCGNATDTDLLLKLLQRNSEQTNSAFGGILAGYIALQPDAGWKVAAKILSDDKQPFSERLSVIGTLRFFHGWKPKENQKPILASIDAAIQEGSFADLVIEDLRRWEWWDSTALVISKYGQRNYDAPLTRRAIMRYALSCPQPKAKEFVTERRKQEATFVADVIETLEWEKVDLPKKP
jgi:hypothetical protein